MFPGLFEGTVAGMRSRMHTLKTQMSAAGMAIKAGLHFCSSDIMPRLDHGRFGERGISLFRAPAASADCSAGPPSAAEDGEVRAGQPGHGRRLTTRQEQKEEQPAGRPCTGDFQLIRLMKARSAFAIHLLQTATKPERSMMAR